jgi:PAS domain-containing protein
MSPQSSYWDYIALLDVFNNAILIYDSERIYWVNHALVSLLGYDSSQEIIGRNILPLARAAPDRRLLIEKIQDGDIAIIL